MDNIPKFVDVDFNNIRNSINKGRAIISMLNGVLWKRQITMKNKLKYIARY